MIYTNSQDPAEFTLPNRRKINRTSPVRWLISHFLPYWWIGVLLLIGAFGNAALAVVIPVIVGDAFNAILEQPPRVEVLAGFAWLIIISQVVRGVLQFGRNFSAEWLGQIFERNIRDELYVSLLGKSMDFHSLQPVGDTMARATNDVREINLMLNPGINMVIGSANFLLLPVMVAPRYHPALIITPLLFVGFYFVLIWQYLYELKPVTESVRETFGRLNTRLAEAIDGIETVKGMAQEKEEVARFKSNADKFKNAFIKQSFIEARYLPLLLLGVAQAFGLLHSLILFNQGIISVGDVIAYFGILQLFGFPTFISLFAYSQVSLGMASSRRILELINLENGLDQNIEGYKGVMKGAVEFQNVSFSYPDSHQALENISFKVEPGQTIAIVGQTGAGKTSLAKLVNRTYDVSKGRLLVDGVEVRDWDMAFLRRQVSIIEQDIFLFSRTIAENIGFGMPGATQTDIETASKAAQAHEFILEFKEGYQTVIGERGVTLSGGQRQRLALARAFLTNPSVLILDDSTSAIDSATEDKIQQAIYKAAKGRTTFIITHRLSQIRWADSILVMSQGKIAAAGSHEELLESSEQYRQIFS